MSILGRIPVAQVSNDGEIILPEKSSVLDCYRFINCSTLAEEGPGQASLIGAGTLRVHRAGLQNKGFIGVNMEVWEGEPEHTPVVHTRLENHFDGFHRKAGLFSLSSNVWSDNDMPQPFYQLTDQTYAYEQGTGLFLAQITTGTDNQPLRPERIKSITYTVFMLDSLKPGEKSPIPGHERVELNLDEVFLEQPVQNNLWTTDTRGYNFVHEPNVSENPMFPVAQKHYSVVYRFSLKDHPNDIILKYRIYVV
ncbi:MAG: hypothetical protein ACRC10_07810 [Thermoguttaceae bacterium]